MQNNNQSLLSVLKNLYSKLSGISLAMMQVRLSSYKRDNYSQINITTVLHNQIDELSSRLSTERINTAEISDESDVLHIKQKNSKAASNHKMKVENITGIESEFVKYLKQRKPTAITQPHLGENLKTSAWQHIHSAIRHAKNGEVDTAKLHISIAGTALEEAGDYMSYEDYSALVLQVEIYFSEPLK
ncbi:MAG: hypothetical protein OQK75_00415 [Gammaproteobacteria bacterium]|nr:hypothetical protein [Gammaproteobacteria bacterium]MCW8986107.1 hypothetical protein [Gammaproteobacteria bacterium]